MLSRVVELDELCRAAVSDTDNVQLFQEYLKGVRRNGLTLQQVFEIPENCFSTVQLHHALLKEDDNVDLLKAYFQALRNKGIDPDDAPELPKDLPALKLLSEAISEISDYDDIKPFNLYGTAIARKGPMSFLIDYTLKEIDFFDVINSPSERRMVVERFGNYWHVRLNGQDLYSERYLYCSDFREKRSHVRLNQDDSSYIKHDGSRLTNEVYEGTGFFFNGLAFVCRDGDYWHIHFDGSDAYTHRFDWANAFNNGPDTTIASIGNESFKINRRGIRVA